MEDKFDDIRPYYQSEIPAAMRRIADSDMFAPLSKFIFPDRDVEDVRRMVAAIRSTEEFQDLVMYHANNKIVELSITNLTYDGIDRLDRTKSYLFVSNHRDIMLDSSLLQGIFLSNGFRTTEITFGSNLMHPQLVVDIGKANKMFKVIRSGNLREFLTNSLHLSEYIRFIIRDKGDSVWIAQRNGRTKDGNDMTDQGIIKMFCMSDGNDPARSLDELNIVPISISYEIESCDILKTKELYLSRDGKKYIKQAGEDLNSILTGIRQQKGRVNLSICRPLTHDELQFDYKCHNDFYKNVATLIDNRIYTNYMLFPNNYIAYDMLAGADEYSDRYSQAEKQAFAERLETMLAAIDGDKEVLRSIFLGIYATPVRNKSRLLVHESKK